MTVNMEIASADFRRAVQLAGKVIERRNTIPIVGMVHCHANGAFEVTGTDLDMALVAAVPRTPGPDADFVMQHPAMVATAVGVSGDKMVAAHIDDGKLILKSGSLDVTVGTMPTDDFPLDLARPLTETFAATLSKSDIAAIARVKDAISTEATRYYLNGVRLRPMGPTTIRAEATDGHRLYMVDIEAPDAVGALPDSVIIPRKAVGVLIDLAKGAEEGVRLVLGSVAPANKMDGIAPARPGALRFGFTTRSGGADLRFCSQLIDGTYPNVTKVIPTHSDKQALFNVADLRRAIAGITGHSKFDRAVKITFNEGGTATLTAAYLSLELCAKVVVPCQHSAKGFSIGFNGGYLASLLSASRGDEIVFGMNDEAAPAVVRNPADTAWSAILMPMRFD
jgi:DNA polymerase-3 subunit beta